MDKNKISKILKKESQTFFDKMGFEVDIKVEAEDSEQFIILAKVDDPQVLIGKKGETLGLLQKLLVKVLSKKINDDVRISLDIKLIDIGNFVSESTFHSNIDSAFSNVAVITDFSPSPSIILILELLFNFAESAIS